MNNKSIDKMFCVQHAQDVKEICKPLFNNTAINYFSHIRATSNRTITGVASSQSWLRHYLEREYYLADVGNSSFDSVHSGYYIWDNSFSEKINATSKMFVNLNKDMRDYNFGQRLLVVDKSEKYIDSYIFAAPSNDEKMPQIYHENREVFLNFIEFFKNKIHRDKFLRKYLHIIQLRPNKSHDYFHICAHKIQDYSLINRKITVKRFYYDVGNNSNYLTEKEMQCLYLLIRQKTFKEVGKLLKISPKTVDNHVEHMKQKTNTNSVRELCDFFRHNLLFSAALKL